MRWLAGWRDPLEGRLRKRVAQLAADAENGEEPDPGQLAGVQALRELVELRSVVSGRSRRAALAVAAGVALLGGLLLLRVRTLEVEGVVRASSVTLVMDRTRVVVLGTPVASLSAFDYTRVDGLPFSGGRSLAAAPRTGGTLTLEQITLPAGARVRVSSDGDGSVLMRVEPAPGMGRVRFTTGGGARAATGGGTAELASGHALVLEFGRARFDLHFTPVAPALDVLAGVGARSISFTETRTVSDGARQDVLAPSMIEAGELVLPRIRDQKITLRPREHLHLRPRALRIHRLRSDTGGITVEFGARASRLARGSDGARRSLKPSYLEWLAADRRLELVRVAYGAGIGLVFLLLARLRRY